MDMEQHNKIIDHAFDADQMRAVTLCTDVSNRIVSVSGPAGSGKSTIIRLVQEQLTKNNIRVAICAPTGKAARRIKDATGIDAMTIHRLLEYSKPGERDPKTGEPLHGTAPKRDKYNPLPYGAVIVDEAAMINNELHQNLINALPTGGVIRYFGDIAQLAPIESRNTSQITDRKDTSKASPFQRMIDNFPSVTLTKVYRQGEGSKILEAANKIRVGHRPPVTFDRAEELAFMITDNPVSTLRKMLMEDMLDAETSGRYIDYASIYNQIITSTKKGNFGTYALNKILQKLYNGRARDTISLVRNRWDESFPVDVAVNDKIVCTENTYDLRPYFDRFSQWQDDGITPIMSSYIPTPETKMMINGEVGKITVINPDGSMEIDFGDRIVELPVSYDELNSHTSQIFPVYPTTRLDLAYALTTHKCQGSEFQNIIYVMNGRNFYTQNRRNFYTAVTRARKSVLVVTDQKSLLHSVSKPE